MGDHEHLLRQRVDCVVILENIPVMLSESNGLWCICFRFFDSEQREGCRVRDDASIYVLKP